MQYLLPHTSILIVREYELFCYEPVNYIRSSCATFRASSILHILRYSALHVSCKHSKNKRENMVAEKDHAHPYVSSLLGKYGLISNVF